MLRLTLILAASTLAALPAPALQNLLADPGFEAVAEDGAFANWTLAAGSPGEVQACAEAHSGQRSARLNSALKDDAHTGALRSEHARPVWGARYRASVWCRGTGSARVGIVRQLRVRRAGEVEFETAWSDPVALTDDWQQLSVEHSLLSAREIGRIWLTVEAQGEGASVVCDDAELALINSLTVTPPYAMVKRGESFGFTVQVVENGEPVTGGALSVQIKNGETTTDSELPITGETTEWGFAAPEQVDNALFSMVLTSADLGVSARVYAHAVDAETYAQFEQAAQAAQIDTPAHLLTIGDSLSDVDRDHNWTDEVYFWLWKANAGQVTYRNAGVGGDYITRVWERIEGKPGAYRHYMYDAMFDPAPTLTFIFLGHNDTKLKPAAEFRSPDDYTDPVVSYEDWDSYMRRAVEYFREQSGGEVVLLSNTSSVYEVCAQRVINNIAAGKSGGSLFGKPEVMERFNEILRAVAQDTGAPFVDVYTPTFEHPDKPSLYLADGVHINQEGNWLVALEVLRSLGE